MRRLPLLRLMASVLFGSVVLASTFAAGAEQVKLTATADLWVSAYGPETNYSMGATNRLKLKGIQEMSLVRFDTSPLRGRRVLGARLFLKECGKKNALRKIGLSTVSARWDEGQGGAYQLDAAGHGGTFLEASYQRRPWAWKGSCLTDVTMGSGQTLQHHTEITRGEGRWVSVDVPPDLVRAMLAGASDGLCLMDESGQTRANNYVWSRRVRDGAPYLLVRLGGDERATPDIARPQARPAPERATLRTGAVELRVRPPRDALAYDITVDGRAVERWRIPFPPGVGEPVELAGRKLPPGAKSDGPWQRILLDELAPGAAVGIAIRTVGPSGLAGAWQTVRAKTSAARPEPRALRVVEVRHAAGDPPERSGALRVWACPGTVKVDPQSNRAQAMLRRANPVWSGGENRILLSAARGEIVGVQLCIEAVDKPLRDVRLATASLMPAARSGGRPIDRSRFDLFTVWYVKAGATWQGEYAIPLRQGEAVDVPNGKNAVPKQVNQSVTVDLFVPKDTPAGEYRGTLTVSARGVRPVPLPVILTVHGFTLPGELNFYGDLNCYGGPGRAGSGRFRASHRLAHAHRCTVVRVPYNHAGTTQQDVTPPLTGRGRNQRVSDWSAFDRDVGPLFDGSMFKGLPRDGVPVNYFYLPLHENWPNTLAKHYDYKGPQRGKGIMKPFALNSKPIQRAFSKEHQEGFSAVARDFALHAKQRGWTRTAFMCSLNNKWYYRANTRGRGTHGNSWWCLDEPNTFDDFQALAFFARRFKLGVGDVEGVRFIFRADISRARWQRNWLYGLLDLMCVSRDLRRWPRRCEIIRRDAPCRQVQYGACNPVDRPNVITHRWCLTSYLLGADGVLPWQTLGGDSSFKEPNTNGIVVDGSRRFGVSAIASLRLKAIRRGVQDVEYLIALARREGWTRAPMRHLRTGSGECREAAGRVDGWSVERLAAVRAAVARRLDGRRAD